MRRTFTILAALTALLLGWLLPERACGHGGRQGLVVGGLIDRKLMREPAQPDGRPAGPAAGIPVDLKF